MKSLLKKYQDIRLTETQNTNISVEHKNAHQDIAIVGLSFMLPHANDLNELEWALRHAEDCIREVQPARKKEVRQRNRFMGIEDKDYSFIQAALLPSIYNFDYQFFGISPMEANCMDPIQRLSLQTGYAAFEDAGFSKRSLDASNTGVFMGLPCATNYYDWVKRIEPELEIMSGPGNINTLVSSRIAYYLNLCGPVLNIDTACSSGLSALHLACRSLISHECECALVAGVNLIFDPVRYHNRPLPDIASLDFRSKTFDESADGAGQGEGVIAVVLQPLAQAQKDNRDIYAVIKGSSLNNDGKSIGITAPNAAAQQSVINEAWKNAEVAPESISYIECHGTGTKLGDPIEVSALSSAFAQYTDRRQFCGIGSIKSNYGHLDSAAGLLGLVKCILSLERKKLFPSVHFNVANRKIDFFNSPLYVVTRFTDWQTEAGYPRRCGLSSFGLGGTNCHIVLEEAPSRLQPTGMEENKWDYLFISAKTESALLHYIDKYICFFQSDCKKALGDICHSARETRDRYPFLLIIAANSKESVLQKLKEAKRLAVPSVHLNGIIIGKQTDLLPQLELIHAQDIPDGIWQQIKQEAQGQIYEEGSLPQTGLICHLPTYPFKDNVCVIDFSKLEEDPEVQTNMQHLPQGAGTETSRDVESEIRTIIADIFEIPAGELTADKTFIELGLDSISIIQLKQKVKKEYQLDIPADQFFGQYNSIAKISDYIQMALPKRKPVVVEAANPSEVVDYTPYITNGSPTGSAILGSDPRIGLIQQQLQLMEKQLALFQGVEPDRAAQATTVIEGDMQAKAHREPLLQKYFIKARHEPTQQQLSYLQTFIKAYEERTIASKKASEEMRPTWANGRMNQGFDSVWKQLIYPIFFRDGKGSRITDIDGNEYTDFAMGFGANLFGYNDPDISASIKSGCDTQLVLGALSKKAGSVSTMICEMTGMDRVLFCNSGTEAVMNALRIARATTSRSKVVVFANAFHGTYDGVYVIKEDRAHTALPASLGICGGAVSDVIICEYGNKSELAVIQKNKQDIAAVLVEPVQSRNPALQPKEFLLELRKFCDVNDCALIFDEIITGFRVAPGGAQEYFGIKADIATYGKVIGGGMPIGIVAGNKRYMDRVDGGAWSFYDQSGPDSFLAHTGGTFCHHPLTLLATECTLQKIKENSPSLQTRLNDWTKRLVNALNCFFDRYRIQLRLVCFSSLFIFDTKQSDALFLQFLYYKILSKGFYLWEGGTCFLSAAHTEQEICNFIYAVEESCVELVQNGCFHANTDVYVENLNQIKTSVFGYSSAKLIATEYQVRLAGRIRAEGKSLNQTIILKTSDAIDKDILQKSAAHLLRRHKILRSVSFQNNEIHLEDNLKVTSFVKAQAGDFQEIIRCKSNQFFNADRGPFIDIVHLAPTNAEKDNQYVLLTASSLIVDGLSIRNLTLELYRLYYALLNQSPLPDDGENTDFEEYTNWLNQRYEKNKQNHINGYWAELFSTDVPDLCIFACPDNLQAASGETNVQDYMMRPDDYALLIGFCGKYNVTPYLFFLTTFLILLNKLSGKSQFIVALPVSHQIKMEKMELIAPATVTTPFYATMNAEHTFCDVIKELETQLECFKSNQVFSYEDVLEEIQETGRVFYDPRPQVSFNYDSYRGELEKCNFALTDDFRSETAQSPYPLFLDCTANNAEIHLSLKSDPNFLLPDTGNCWMTYYVELLLHFLENSADRVNEVKLT